MKDRALRVYPAVAWIAAAVVMSFLHRFVPHAGWLMVHLALLGAVTHSAFVWSEHFARTLLHQPESESLRPRVALLAGGTVLVMAGIVLGEESTVGAGAAVVASAAVWHVAWLATALRAALAPRFGHVVRYYLAAGCLLPVGAVLGWLMTTHWLGAAHEQVKVAHVAVNVLGWVGLTVVGTLVTFWPTVLRTPMPSGAETASRRSLPVLVAALLMVLAGALAGSRPLAAVGLAGFTTGVALHVPAWWRAARAKPPMTYAAASITAAIAWLLALPLVLAGRFALAPTWGHAGLALHELAPYLAVGVAVQVLLGALSYLLTVAVGGPSAARAAERELDRGGLFRVAATNAGLLTCLAPVPSLVRVLASLLVLGCLVAFLPLAWRSRRAAARAAGAARETGAAMAGGPAPVAESAWPSAGVGAGPAVVRPAVAGSSSPAAADPVRRPRAHARLATGLAAVLATVVIGAALDPLSLADPATWSLAGGVQPSGRTTTVQVNAANMRFTPGEIRVGRGDRVVLIVTNTDPSQVHDLVMASGHSTGRLAPGQSATLDLGVVGAAVDGWCSITGHRQMGMTLRLEVEGGAAAVAAPPGAGGAEGQGGHGGGHGGPDPASDPAASGPSDDAARPSPSGSAPAPSGGPSIPGGGGHDMGAMAPPSFTEPARDLRKPPLPSGRTHRVTLRVQEVEREVAPGRRGKVWTFNGAVPGPTLRGRVGDDFVVTLVNDGTMGHSVDFHAGETAPDQRMRTIAPGQSLEYRFTANRSGIWMYHCSTMPMTAHIAAGMFGAVIIDPPDLPRADHEFVLLQSEYYLAADGATDPALVTAEKPTYVVFNGKANQYDAAQPKVRAGERVRFWVLDIGPNRPMSFHVVGGQFDRTWSEGRYLLGSAAAPTRGAGAQVLPLLPAQGGFAELTFAEPGHYPFVSHVMVDAERGAHGVVEVVAP